MTVRTWTGVLLAVAAAAWCMPTARAQAAKKGAAPAPATAPAADPPQVSDLTTRYRFLERYATDQAKAGPDDVVQYRVASKDVLKRVTEKPQGTPDRAETTVQVIYTERPASVSPTGQVTDTVRAYDAVRISPAPEAKPSARRPLEGLTLWYRSRPTSGPLLMTLEGTRGMTEVEYTMTTRLAFTPDLVGVLPSLPIHAGDRWRVPRSAARALLGDRPQGKNDTLVATLLDVKKAAKGDALVAVIGVSGRAMVGPAGRDTTLNAQVEFTFAPPAPAQAAAPGSDGAVDAHGAITKLKLARSSSMPVPSSNGRLKSTFTWELLLERQINSNAAAIVVPSPAPTPSPENSWLTYEDPAGRFHFRHPQELLPLEGGAKDDVIQFADGVAGATEGKILTVVFQPRNADPAVDKSNRDPEFHVKDLNEEWTRDHKDVIRGKNGWLPDADWAPLKMKVYRIEAALRPAGAGRDVPRIFLDHYLALFGGTESLVVEAMTGLDDPIPFRKQVEEIIKTFKTGPPQPPA